jgi:hypothetical protein
MWPIQLPFLLLEYVGYSSSTWLFVTLQFLTQSVQLIFSVFLQHHISKLSRRFWVRNTIGNYLMVSVALQRPKCWRRLRLFHEQRPVFLQQKVLDRTQKHNASLTSRNAGWHSSCQHRIKRLIYRHVEKCPILNFDQRTSRQRNLRKAKGLSDRITLWRRNYFFFNFSTPCIYKMWIIQEPKKLALWNKLHFEEKKNGEYRACLKYSVPLFVE